MKQANNIKIGLIVLTVGIMSVLYIRLQNLNETEQGAILNTDAALKNENQMSKNIEASERELRRIQDKLN